MKKNSKKQPEPKQDYKDHLTFISEKQKLKQIAKKLQIANLMLDYNSDLIIKIESEDLKEEQQKINVQLQQNIQQQFQQLIKLAQLLHDPAQVKLMVEDLVQDKQFKKENKNDEKYIFSVQSIIQEENILKLESQIEELISKIKLLLLQQGHEFDQSKGFQYSIRYQEFYEDVVELCNEFDFTSDFYENINSNLFTNLTAMALSLKPLKPEQREIKLKEYKQISNKHMSFSNNNPVEDKILSGLSYPIEQEQSVVVRILDEFHFFETKRRVPFKIIFETVDSEELKKNIKYEQQQQLYNSSNQIISNKLNRGNSNQYMNDINQIEMNLNRNLSYQNNNNLMHHKFSRKQSDPFDINHLLLSHSPKHSKKNNISLHYNNLQQIQQQQQQLQDRKQQSLQQIEDDDEENQKYQNLYKLQQNHDSNLQSVDEGVLKNSSSDEEENRILRKIQKKHSQAGWSKERKLKYKQNFQQFNRKFHRKYFIKSQQQYLKRRYSIQVDTEQILLIRKEEHLTSIQPFIQQYCNNKVKRQVTFYSKIQFLKQMQQEYQVKQNIFEKIFKKLNYDLIEQMIKNKHNHTIHSNNNKQSTSQEQKSLKLQQNQTSYQPEKINLKSIENVNINVNDVKLQQEDNEDEIQTQFPRNIGPWRQLWEDKARILKKESQFGEYNSYQIHSIIIKGDDDVRQEYVCMQLIQLINQIFQSNQETKQLWLKPYEIIVTSKESGIIEFLPDTQSIDAIKKKIPGICLQDLFEEYFNQNEEQLEIAQQNFLNSLAAYSIVSYILSIKDRHNGNILIDSQGHIIHIDFGFILGCSPGGINFEKAHFKLTKEYAQVIGGKDSKKFKQFSNIFEKGFQLLQQPENQQQLEQLILKNQEEYPDIPCFKQFNIDQFKDKFKPNAQSLIKQSYEAWSTKGYDLFQYTSNGIAR